MPDLSMSVLVIEDSPIDVRLVQEMLRPPFGRFAVSVAITLAAGMQSLKVASPDAILLDLGLPDGKGFDTLVAVHRTVPDIPIVVLTADGDEAVGTRALQNGAQDYLLKGKVDGGLLRRALAYAVERNRAEHTLRAERDRAQQYLDVAGVILLGVDPQGRVNLINRTGTSLLGMSEEDLLGQDWLERFVPQEWRTAVSRQLSAMTDDPGAISVFENPVLTASGETRVIAWRNTTLHDPDGKPLGTLSSGEDVTDRRRLEERLRHAEKMQSIGRLAGGVAHDFNNQLTAVLGYASFALESLPDGHPARDDIEQVVRAATRVSKLTHQLLAFSSRQVIQPKDVNLNEVVAESVKDLLSVLGDGIKLTVRYVNDPCPARVDPDQIRQVILNLASNARDAMPSGGEVCLETEARSLTERELIEAPELCAGDYVVLSMTDMGMGMSPGVMSHIFEPFFTTKAVGDGAGLGLATSYGIVHQHGGAILVESRPGRGSKFSALFPCPAVREEADRDLALAAGVSHPGATVLVAEDEPTIKDLVARTLRLYGYNVLAASGGQEALDMAAEHTGPIDLLLTDVVMPGIDGRLLHERLRSVIPGLRTLFISGYVGPSELAVGPVGEPTSFLAKPFTAKDLIRKVGEALDSPASASESTT